MLQIPRVEENGRLGPVNSALVPRFGGAPTYALLPRLDEAKAAGVNVTNLRLLTVLASTMITASCVSMCGQVGWIGLLVPHCSRMLCGNNNRFVVPFSIVFGALFMLAIDTVCRTMFTSELPISVITALIGAPVFIVLLRRTRGGMR